MLIQHALKIFVVIFAALAFSVSATWSQESFFSGRHLNLADFEITYSEDFDVLDVSPHGPGTRWTAHTPWNGDFGDAVFTDPTPNFPFTVHDGILQIEARIDAGGQWRSGLLASANSDGNGFSQQYGYFEIRAKLPSGPGVWPAFWLSSIASPSASTSVEIDVFEYYGHFPAAFHSVMHVWFAGGGNRGESHVHHVPQNSLSDVFNLYGVLVEADWTRFFFNRIEYWRVRTPVEHTRPLLILLNLALGSGWPIDQTSNPSYMLVDYVRVYARREATHTPEQRAVIECSNLAVPKEIALCVGARLVDADVEKCLRGECFGLNNERTKLLREIFGRSGDDPAPCGNYEISSSSTGNIEFNLGKRWRLCSGNEFIFQYDGNLVLYDGHRTPIWTSGTSNQKVVQLSMQSDGNLVIYNVEGTAIWSTRTGGNFGATLAIQEDGNVVIYGSGGRPLWSTGIAGRATTNLN